MFCWIGSNVRAWNTGIFSKLCSRDRQIQYQWQPRAGENQHNSTLAQHNPKTYSNVDIRIRSWKVLNGKALLWKKRPELYTPWPFSTSTFSSRDEVLALASNCPDIGLKMVTDQMGAEVSRLGSYPSSRQAEIKLEKRVWREYVELVSSRSSGSCRFELSTMAPSSDRLTKFV